jgi:hypothetical protein
VRLWIAIKHNKHNEANKEKKCKKASSTDTIDDWSVNLHCKHCNKNNNYQKQKTGGKPSQKETLPLAKDWGHLTTIGRIPICHFIGSKHGILPYTIIRKISRHVYHSH